MPTTYDPNGAAFNHQPRTSTLGGRSTKSRKSDSVRPESSRVLFLLYLIHRTWNIMVETVDIKNKRYVIGTNCVLSAQLRRHTHTHSHKVLPIYQFIKYLLMMSIILPYKFVSLSLSHSMCISVLFLLYVPVHACMRVNLQTREKLSFMNEVSCGVY